MLSRCQHENYITQYHSCEDSEKTLTHVKQIPHIYISTYCRATKTARQGISVCIVRKQKAQMDQNAIHELQEVLNRKRIDWTSRQRSKFTCYPTYISPILI